MRNMNANTKKGTTPSHAHVNLGREGRALSASLFTASSSVTMDLLYVRSDGGVPALGDERLRNSELIGGGGNRRSIGAGRRQLGLEVSGDRAAGFHVGLVHAMSIALHPAELASVGVEDFHPQL